MLNKLFNWIIKDQYNWIESVLLCCISVSVYSGNWLLSVIFWSLLLIEAYIISKGVKNE